MNVIGPKFVEHIDHSGEVVAAGEFYAVSSTDTAPDWAFVWASYDEALMAANANQKG